MYQSKTYIPTLKNIPSNAEVKSHILLLKAGYIHQSAAGIYTYLSLATKVLSKIETIIREELDKIEANEIRMPFLEPSELWKESSRWFDYGPELFRVIDRHQREFALAPTHEELSVDVVRNFLNSYKKYPMNIYQIQTKMRDERRPRFGLLRGREFIMMDGYTFDLDANGLEINYYKYYNAYKKIFDKLGLNYKVVNADNGSMGGYYSHEFMAISEVGEDFIAFEEESDLAYNTEIAPVCNKYVKDQSELLQEEEVYTKNLKKIDDLISEFSFEKDHMLKAIAYNIDEILVIGFVLGHREIEETKLLNLVNGNTITLADEKMLMEHGLISGFIGPSTITDPSVKVFIDREAFYTNNLVVGAGKLDYHLKNYNIDSSLEQYDIRKIESGDLIQDDGKPVKIAKGIEIGHVFALGDKYSKSMNLRYLSKEQKEKIPLMGSYGIGVSRLLSTVVEQNSNENEIILPKNISPFDIHLIGLDYAKDNVQRAFLEKIHKNLKNKNYTILIDDRNERVGSKFKDADLIGIPLQIVVGKKYKENIVEYKDRINNISEDLTLEELLSRLAI